MSRVGASLRKSSSRKSLNGFEELRLDVKEGGDLCKELSSILLERSELEAIYAKGLTKLASKLSKTTGELQGRHGTVTAAWASVALEMESEAELHKSLSVSLSEELVKPLKVSVESHHRIRKAVEAGVDKTSRVLTEWRSAQAKAKKNCYMTARDNEKMQDQIFNDARLGKPKTLTDKEMAKLEAKCKKTDEAVRKAEGEYYTCCTRAERSRLEWETATQRGGRCFHALEQERLIQMKELVSKYYASLREYGPKLCQSVARLDEPVNKCNIEADLHHMTGLRDSAPAFSEQMLPDFYAEHMSNVMNRERRKISLDRCLHWVRSDVEKESRARRGVQNLSRALHETPNFGGQESKQEIDDKLLHIRSMLAFFEMTRIKLHNAASDLMEPNQIPKLDHPLCKYLEVYKDKQGMMQSVLKLPPWIEMEELDKELNDDREAGDGNSGQPDSDFDEFSSQESDNDSTSHSVIPSANYAAVPSIGKCRVLYSYAANMYDELSIQPGDVLNIHDKQADGWWLGELDGTVGIFPATYVEEF